MYQQPFSFKVPTSGIIQFPHEFVESVNPKFVQVLKVNCYVPLETDAYGNECVYPLYATPENISVHSTFNQNFSQNDRFICFTNEELTTPKMFQQFTSQLFFHVWFKDMDGNVLPIENAKITIQTILIY